MYGVLYDKSDLILLGVYIQMAGTYCPASIIWVVWHEGGVESGR